MKTENYEAINKALRCAEKQLERLKKSGDQEEAKELAVCLLGAWSAIYDEAGK